MGYIIYTRNPTSKRLIVITEDDEHGNERIAEFDTDELAEDAAQNTTICKAWGYWIDATPI